MNLMGIFGIIPMFCTLHLADEPLTTSVYSKIGLHRLVYASSSAYWRALCMKGLIPLSILLDLTDFSAIWRLNLKSNWSITLRYFVFLLQARHVDTSLYWTTGVTLPKFIAKHLASLNCIFRVLAHSHTAFMFFKQHSIFWTVYYLV